MQVSKLNWLEKKSLNFEEMGNRVGKEFEHLVTLRN